MRSLRMLMLRLRAIFRRPQVESELESELADHIASETEDLIARGVAPADAHRRALESLGRVAVLKDECRDARGTAGWEDLRQDIRFGLRLLLKHRTYSLMALATMALGIGSTTAVYSLVDGVLIQPLPFAEPHKLYDVSVLGMRGPFDTMRANSRFADYAARLGVRPFTTAGRDFPERLPGCEVSANFFRVLGIQPMLGHGFADQDDRPGVRRVALLSYRYWRQRHGGRTDIVGQQLMLDERNYEIVGVMPPEFTHPSTDVSFWVPMTLDPRNSGAYWGVGGVTTIARLRPGASAEAANAELVAWIPRVRALFPWRMPDAWGADARFLPLQQSLVAGAKLPSLLLLGVTALVLLIVIVNLANLTIAQAASRQRELALRASLGATPARLSRQLLTEAILLAIGGGALGMALAFGQFALLKQVLPPGTPRLAEVTISGRILGCSALLSLGTGLLFGLLPAWRARRTVALAASEDSRSTLGPTRLRADGLLVMSEAAFATVLVLSASLLGRSLWTMLQIQPGFRTESVVTAELNLNREAAGSLPKAMSLYGQVQNELSAHAGVTQVAAANLLPLTPEISVFTGAIEDHPRPERAPQIPLWVTFATPGYLSVLDVRLLQGRIFTDADGPEAERVALISRATAKRFWPNQSPIGRRLRPFASEGWRTIVGVVEDVRNFSITGPPDWVEGSVYLPLAQSYYSPRTLSVIARLEGDVEGFERQLPQLIKASCPHCAVSKIRKMDAVVSASVEAPRSLTWLVGGFAVLALGLSAAGIYGVTSHGVIRRRRELGVRLALGASRGQVAWLILSASLRQVLLGTAAGLLLAYVAARAIRSLLYGITEHDPLSLSIAPMVLVMLTIVATLVPVYQAIRIDPVNSLREG